MHLAEAMWLGTPVIATRYSGNLDLMDDDCSILIDASLVHVERGGASTAEARWADPDLDQAAGAMRGSPPIPRAVQRFAAAGRARIGAPAHARPTPDVLIADLLGIEPAS